MKTLIFVIMVTIFVAATGYCEQKYNAFTNKWETVPDNSNWQTKYNAFDHSWSYQPRDAKTEYNAFENRWEWDSGHNPGDE